MTVKPKNETHGDTHNRRSIRLKGYKYDREGMYFITICCQDKICRFGDIQNDEMQLNEYGQIAYDEWIKLPDRFNKMQLDVFQIMPNHMHGILSLQIPDDGPHTPVVEYTDTSTPTIGQIIGTYKSLVTKACLELHKSNCIVAGHIPDQIPQMGKIWQRNYYEHIIRNEKSYHTIAEYIVLNPMNWKNDKMYIG